MNYPAFMQWTIYYSMSNVHPPFYILHTRCAQSCNLSCQVTISVAHFFVGNVYKYAPNHFSATCRTLRICTSDLVQMSRAFIVVPVIMAQVIWSVASGPSCCTLRTPCAQCLCAVLRAHMNPCGALTTPDTLLEQRVLHPFKQRSRCLNVQ